MNVMVNSRSPTTGCPTALPDRALGGAAPTLPTPILRKTNDSRPHREHKHLRLGTQVLAYVPNATIFRQLMALLESSESLHPGRRSRCPGHLASTT